MKRYVISDPHYSHKNLIKGISLWDDKSICRDFDTLEDHNKFIVDEINSKVNTDDILYCLGDWAFTSIEHIRIFRNQLKVKTIHLLFGNHDHNIINNRENTQSLFSTVQYYLELPIDKHNKVIMCHYPIESWNGIHKGSVHLFGHQHSDRVGKGRKMDVGFDASGRMKGVYNLDLCIEKLLSLEIEGGTGDSAIEVNIK